MVNASSRRAVEECFKWASQRKVFGKPLINQAVIRQKLASMIARVEAVQSWLESVTYQMNNVSILLCFFFIPFDRSRFLCSSPFVFSFVMSLIDFFHLIPF